MHDQAFFGFAGGLLRRGGNALLAKNIHGLIDFAATLGQRLLALHQASPGHLAELANICCCELRHN